MKMPRKIPTENFHLQIPNHSNDTITTSTTIPVPVPMKVKVLKSSQLILNQALSQAHLN